MIYYPPKKVALTTTIPESARDWRNEREIFRWCRQYTLIDENSHERWQDKISTDPSIKMFGVTDHKTSLPVGVAGLTSIDKHNQSAEFSLYIAKGSQGLGYGKDTLKTLLAHGFFDMNLNRIWGETFSGNPALKMFRDLGMTVEGELRQTYYREGRFISSFVVSILRSEFERRFEKELRA